MLIPEFFALLLYGLTIGVLFTLVVEVWWLQFSGTRWFWLRAVFTIVKYGFVSVLGAFTERLKALIVKNSKNYFRTMIADTIAFGTYQVALYMVIALYLFQIPWNDVLSASAAYLLQFLAFGWVYSLALSKIEPRFPAFKSRILSAARSFLRIPPVPWIKEKILGLKTVKESQS